MKRLYPEDRTRITPLIELLPSQIPLYSASARTQFVEQFCSRLSEVWGTPPAFVDLRYLGAHFLVDGRSPWDVIGKIASRLGVSVVPVVPLARALTPHLDVLGPGRDRASGVALRLNPLDLELSSLRRAAYFSRLLRHLRLEPGQVDLLMDFEFTCDTAPSYVEMCSKIPSLHEWRSFTVLSGDFPADLQSFRRGEPHYKARGDWRAWRDQVAEEARLPRIPAYGDYTIQYATYRRFEGIPNPSVSVRYTLEDQWLILRGEACSERGPGFEQWTGWAQLLCEMPDYMSAEFSAGDAYVFERTQVGAGTGNHTSWLAAGINHHMTLTSKQVSSARVPAADGTLSFAERVGRLSARSNANRGRAVASTEIPEQRPNPRESQ